MSDDKVEACGLLVDCGDGRWALAIQANGIEIDRLVFDTEDEAQRAFNDFGLMLAIPEEHLPQ